MPIQVKHKFVSAKVDTLDNSKVQPSNWNADHDILVAGGVVVGRAAGAGQAAATEIPMGVTGQAVLAAANQAAAQAAVGADATGATILAAATKATPVDADSAAFIDSAAGNVIKRVTWAQIKATLKAYFDTLYVAASSTLSALGAIGAAVQGDTIISTGAGVWTRLGKGAALQQLRMNAAGTMPEWGTAGGRPDAVLEDQKPANTDGGDSVTGVWSTRVLNTEVYDPSGLMTLVANQFTPSVNGWVEFSCPAYNMGVNSARLFNVTDNIDVAYGGAQYTSGSSTTSVSSGGGPVVAGKTYRIEHRGGGASHGFGLGNPFSTCVYTRVKFWRT